MRNQLTPRGRVLLVIPGDLHAKTVQAAQDQWGIPIRVLDSQLTYESYLVGTGPDRRLPNGFYITSYTQLATNGVMRMPDPDKWDPVALMEWLCLKPEAVERHWGLRAALYRDQYDLLHLDPAETTLERLEAALLAAQMRLEGWYDQKAAARESARLERAAAALRTVCPAGEVRFDCLSADQLTELRRAVCEAWIQTCSEGINECQEGIRCVYSPTLADLCWDGFDCVVVDEGVKMKGGDTLVGQGVRKLDPKYRLVLTATPVKNRVPDLFWLGWWAAGGQAQPHARWPFAGEAKEQDTFAETFLVAERNKTREKQAEAEGKRRRFEKLTAEVCNVHRLWKLLAPVVLRRRKEDTGEVIVPKIRHVVRVPMGAEQQRCYAYHVHSDYRDKNGQKAIGPQLQALRVVAGDPTSELLQTVNGTSARTRLMIHRSSQDYTPKVAAALKLIEQILRAREQVVVFSAFHTPLDTLSRYLTRAGVRHITLDGRMSQRARGAQAVEFRKGLASGIPVQLAGVESMSEGHDFYLASNAILLSFSWAYDKFEQAINRVHRMTSPKPVNVYSIVTEGTIDRRLESLLHEKGDSADLVLDGKLLGERAEEVNLAELLASAVDEFDAESQSVNEQALAEEWPGLEQRLRSAMGDWAAGADQTDRTDRTDQKNGPTGQGSAPTGQESGPTGQVWRPRRWTR